MHSPSSGVPCNTSYLHVYLKLSICSSQRRQVWACKYKHTYIYTYIHTYTQRWYIDGSIQCFSGGHIPLSMVAILMISALVAFIPMTLVFSLKEFEVTKFITAFSSSIELFFQDPVWFKRIQKALCFWFKDRYKWWYSVELFRRLILILMVVPFPGNGVCMYVTMYMWVHMYMYVYMYV